MFAHLWVCGVGRLSKQILNDFEDSVHAFQHVSTCLQINNVKQKQTVAFKPFSSFPIRAHKQNARGLILVSGSLKDAGHPVRSASLVRGHQPCPLSEEPLERVIHWVGNGESWVRAGLPVLITYKCLIFVSIEPYELTEDIISFVRKYLFVCSR